MGKVGMITGREDEKGFKAPRWKDLVGRHLTLHLESGTSHPGTLVGFDEDAGALNFRYPVTVMEESGIRYDIREGIFHTNRIAGWNEIEESEIDAHLKRNVFYREFINKEVEVDAKEGRQYKGTLVFAGYGMIELKEGEGKRQIPMNEIVSVFCRAC